MLNNTRYHKIGGDENDEISSANNVKEDPQYSEDKGVELLNNLEQNSTIRETSTVADSSSFDQRKDDNEIFKKLKLKVLFKEKSFDIFCAENVTVLQLKQEIFSQTDIPEIQQRLIFSGRQLKPDEKQLTSFKIINNSPIHLFPLPSAQAIVVPEVVLPGDNPMHFDPNISQISREVKFWCVILIFLSSFTLFNIFTFVTST
eukprot:gene28607-37804_t